jgi:PAS domain S-box-containing protein
MEATIGTYNYTLVLFSFIISVIASFTAFDLAGRVSLSQGIARKIWLIGGSIAMGIGIWSMHFVAMLAFHMPIPVTYNVITVMFSMFAAILGSFIALYHVSQPNLSSPKLVMGSIIMGASIVSMHYIGMKAMQMKTIIHYNKDLVIISIFIAIIASFAALFLTFRYRAERSSIKIKFLSSVVMGIAISGMHYTAMHAARVNTIVDSIRHSPLEIDNDLLAFSIGIISLIILGLVLIGVFVDRKFVFQAQKLKESEQQYKSLFEHNTDAICSFDLEGNFLTANIAYENITGYTIEEMFQTSFSFIVHRQDLDKRKYYFEKTKQGESQSFEMTATHKNGHLIFLSVKTVPIIVDDQIVGVYGIARDVTEQKNTENEREQLRHKVELILNASGDGIYGIDNNGKTTFVNPAAANMIGYKVEELVGTYQHDIIHHSKADGSHYHREECPIHAVLKDGKTRHVTDEVFWRNDGTYFPVEYITNPIIENDEIIGAVVTFQDITERRKTEDLLLRSDKLSVLGQMSAGIAHEIRNPITALKGFLQLMKSNVEENRYVDIMLSEIERINLIVGEFLFLAKPNEILFETKDIKILLHNVITLLDTQAIINNVQILTDFSPEIPFIQCDENQLKQVFVNILKNAIESMPKGGNIVVEVKREDDENVLIRFTDQGCGIPEDKLSKLGEPFYTTKETGTGLGLMVSYKIIEAHQGHMKIHSEINKGTIVEVTLVMCPDSILV